MSQIMAIACESPEQSGRPVDHWTHRELADEAKQRGIVTGISASQVGRYLAESDLQPHRSKYWLNTTEKDPDVFQTQVEDVCQAWRDAPELYFQANTHTVSVDEMPGLQALERIAKTIPMQPGQPKRIEFEYKRYGTLCLIGNWHVVLGQMISPTIKPTRTEDDFAWHIFYTVQTDPNAGWVFVLDNLNVHCSTTLVCYVAELEGIDGDRRANRTHVDAEILCEFLEQIRGMLRGERRPRTERPELDAFFLNGRVDKASDGESSKNRLQQTT